MVGAVIAADHGWIPYPVVIEREAAADGRRREPVDGGAVRPPGDPAQRDAPCAERDPGARESERAEERAPIERTTPGKP